MVCHRFLLFKFLTSCWNVSTPTRLCGNLLLIYSLYNDQKIQCLHKWTIFLIRRKWIKSTFEIGIKVRFNVTHVWYVIDFSYSNLSPRVEMSQLLLAHFGEELQTDAQLRRRRVIENTIAWLQCSDCCVCFYVKISIFLFC